MDRPSPIRGDIDFGHEWDDTGSRGDIYSSGGSVTITVISPFPAGRFRNYQDQSAVRNLDIDS
jgi:hypothetical protein